MRKSRANVPLAVPFPLPLPGWYASVELVSDENHSIPKTAAGLTAEFRLVCCYQVQGETHLHTRPTQRTQQTTEMAHAAEPGAVNGVKSRKVAIITGITGQVKIFCL